MSLVDDIKAAQAATNVAIDSIAADEAAQAKEIEDLKAQVAAGSPATVEDLQSILDNSKAIQKRLEDLDATVPAPVVP